MTLSSEYLHRQHALWMQRISEAGIWDASRFLPCEIVIRKNHKRYNALFQRRIKFEKGIRQISDKIVFYNRVDDFEPQFIDNVLVHEMIHQYIIQNEIKDTSTHGKIFKAFMLRINREFPDELAIKIRDTNPSIPLKGEGEKIHSLLLIHFHNLTSICAVINPAKNSYFESLMKRNMKGWNIKSYQWAESNDVYFNQFSRCTTRLHGLRINTSEIERFCREYNIRIMQNSVKSSPRKRKWSLFGLR